MINTIAIKSDDGPKKDFFPSDYVGEENMADTRQVSILTDLVLQKVGDADERERWLSEINSGMTSDDAESYIFSFLTGQW